MESYRLGNPLLDDDGDDGGLGEVSQQGRGLDLQDDKEAEEDYDAKGEGEEDQEDQEDQESEVWPIRKAIFTKVSAPVFM